MNFTRLNELIELWSDGRLSEGDGHELNSLLRESREARAHFGEASRLHGLLHAAADSLAVDLSDIHTATGAVPVVSLAASASRWHTMIGVVVGLLIGMISVSAVWAFASPRLVAVSRTISELSSGSFEEENVPPASGFPNDYGVWGGDHVGTEVRDLVATAEGRQVLRFISALPDAARPDARAIACDLFQLVDLRGPGFDRANLQDVSLELTASFLDERQANSQPSVTFFCQLYLFRGDGRSVHERWPTVISEAVSSGSAEVTTLGQSGWCEVTARCFVPRDVDFAVVHVAARPNLRVPMPSGLFVDHVRLLIKAQPVLPVQSAREG